MKKHRADPAHNKMFTCSPCQVGFRSIDALEEHKKFQKHRQKEERVRAEAEARGVGLADTTQVCLDPEHVHVTGRISKTDACQGYPCTKCDKSFSTKLAMELHRNGPAHIYCDVCDIKFDSKRALRDHRKAEDKDMTLECGPCDRSFNSRHQFAEHQKTKNHLRNVEEYTCRFCDVAFEWGHQAEEHAESEEHARRVGELTCRVCEESFWHEDELDEHLDSEDHYRLIAREFRAQYEVCLECDLTAAAG
jgi:transposase-like protein